MKRCTACKEEKPLTEFNWKSKAKGTRQSECLPCGKATAKRWYDRNKSSVVKAVEQRKRKRLVDLNEMKAHLGCILCHEDEPRCLDFHHLDPSEKESDISTMLNHVSKHRFEEELKKCVCVCSNCHRKVHAGLVSIMPL